RPRRCSRIPSRRPRRRSGRSPRLPHTPCWRSGGRGPAVTVDARRRGGDSSTDGAPRWLSDTLEEIVAQRRQVALARVLVEVHRAGAVILGDSAADERALTIVVGLAGLVLDQEVLDLSGGGLARGGAVAAARVVTAVRGAAAVAAAVRGAAAVVAAAEARAAG